jgi:hypothetical protein
MSSGARIWRITGYRNYLNKYCQIVVRARPIMSTVQVKAPADMQQLDPEKLHQLYSSMDAGLRAAANDDISKTSRVALLKNVIDNGMRYVRGVYGDAPGIERKANLELLGNNGKELPLAWDVLARAMDGYGANTGDAEFVKLAVHASRAARDSATGLSGEYNIPAADRDRINRFYNGEGYGDGKTHEGVLQRGYKPEELPGGELPPVDLIGQFNAIRAKMGLSEAMPELRTAEPRPGEASTTGETKTGGEKAKLNIAAEMLKGRELLSRADAGAETYATAAEGFGKLYEGMGAMSVHERDEYAKLYSNALIEASRHSTVAAEKDAYVARALEMGKVLTSTEGGTDDAKISRVHGNYVMSLAYSTDSAIKDDAQARTFARVAYESSASAEVSQTAEKGAAARMANLRSFAAGQLAYATRLTAEQNGSLAENEGEIRKLHKESLAGHEDNAVLWHNFSVFEASATAGDKAANIASARGHSDRAVEELRKNRETGSRSLFYSEQTVENILGFNKTVNHGQKPADIGGRKAAAVVDEPSSVAEGPEKVEEPPQEKAQERKATGAFKELNDKRRALEKRGLKGENVDGELVDVYIGLSRANQKHAKEHLAKAEKHLAKALLTDEDGLAETARYVSAPGKEKFLELRQAQARQAVREDKPDAAIRFLDEADKATEGIEKHADVLLERARLRMDMADKLSIWQYRPERTTTSALKRSWREEALKDYEAAIGKMAAVDGKAVSELAKIHGEEGRAAEAEILTEANKKGAVREVWASYSEIRENPNDTVKAYNEAAEAKEGKAAGALMKVVGAEGEGNAAEMILRAKAATRLESIAKQTKAEEAIEMYETLLRLKALSEEQRKEFSGRASAGLMARGETYLAEDYRAQTKPQDGEEEVAENYDGAVKNNAAGKHAKAAKQLELAYMKLTGRDIDDRAALQEELDGTLTPQKARILARYAEAMVGQSESKKGDREDADIALDVLERLEKEPKLTEQLTGTYRTAELTKRANKALED